MKQRLYKSKRAKRRARRKGRDPAYSPKKQKFVALSEDRLWMGVTHSPETGNPTTNNTDGGIRFFTFRWNDIRHPIQGSTKSSEGFAKIAPDWEKFYVIGAKARFDFDMREVAPYKLYMITHQNANFWISAGITPDFTTDSLAEGTRAALLAYLERVADKKNMSSHWLQRGDGYNSVGSVSLKYKPKLFDPDRGNILDDDNEEYAVKGERWRAASSSSALGNSQSPTDVDYCSIILVPTSLDYMTAYFATDPNNLGGTLGTVSAVWGRFHLEQIHIAVKNENAPDGRIRAGITDTERTGTLQPSNANPAPAQ